MTRKVYRRGRDGQSPISQQNSTSTLLAAHETFTGPSDDVNDMSAAAVFILTDKTSSTEGILFQCSADDENWSTTQKATAQAGVNLMLEVPLQARFFRVVYENGGAAQTSFSLQVIYHDRAAVAQFADKPVPVRISNGAGFESLGDLLLELKELNSNILESNRERKLTNQYLAQIVGEEIRNEDIE